MHVISSSAWRQPVVGCATDSAAEHTFPTGGRAAQLEQKEGFFFFLFLGSFVLMSVQHDVTHFQAVSCSPPARIFVFKQYPTSRFYVCVLFFSASQPACNYFKDS